MRVDSAIGGALRDLAVATGDRAAARRAIDATARSRAQVPPRGTVFPGDTVLLQARSGSIGIDVEAVVQAEAAPGQQVAVRTRHSSDTLTGRLTAAGTVVIE